MGPPASLKKPNTALRQLHLDFGQRTIGAQRCTRCGMVFETVHEDLNMHARVCKALADRNAAAAAAQSQQASTRASVETLAASGRAKRIFAGPGFDTFAIGPRDGAAALRESIDAFVAAKEATADAEERAGPSASPLRQCRTDDTLVALFRGDALAAVASARRLPAPVRVAACIRDVAVCGAAAASARSTSNLRQSPNRATADSPVLAAPAGCFDEPEPMPAPRGCGSPAPRPATPPTESPAPRDRSASPGPRVDGEVSVTYLKVVGVIDAWTELRPTPAVSAVPAPAPEATKAKQPSLMGWFGAAATATSGLDTIASSLMGAGPAGSRRRARDADAAPAGSITAAMYRAMTLALALDPATPVRCFAFGRALVDSGTAARVARVVVADGKPVAEGDAGAVAQALRIAVHDPVAEGEAGASEFYTEWVS